MYIELVVRCDGIATLAQAVAGAVAAFGAAGDTCYWRTKTDYEERLGNYPSAYVRFCISNKPELPQEQAA